MDYVEIKLSSRCSVFLTPQEIGKLLQKDTALYAEGISRGKKIKRYRQHQEQFKDKWEKEQGFH